MLYTRHKDPLYRYCLRSCGSSDIAEEIFQDVWAKVIKSDYKIQSNASFKTYLYTIARNRLIDHHRGNQFRLIELDEEKLYQEPDEHSETFQEVLAAINHLPNEQKEVLILRFEQALDFEDIASICQCKIETARSRYRYGIAKLNELLGQDRG